MKKETYKQKTLKKLRDVNNINRKKRNKVTFNNFDVRFSPHLSRINTGSSKQTFPEFMYLFVFLNRHQSLFKTDRKIVKRYLVT